jgi:hypothetical protein
MPGDKIGMQVSLENMADLDTIFLGCLEVEIHVPLGIDYDSFSTGGQQV